MQKLYCDCPCSYAPFNSGPLKTRMISIIQLKHLSHDFIALLMDFLNTEEKRQRRMVHLPMGRFGEAVELAKAALFCGSFSRQPIKMADHWDIILTQWPAMKVAT